MTAPGLVADPGSIETIASAIQSRRTDPVALVEASLRRIDAVENQVHGWCALDRDGAMAQARALRAEAEKGHIRGPLHGIPVAIKDVLDVAGLPTRAGSKTRADIAPSTIDAEVVTRLRVAGAVILGKAHTTEFAYFDGPPPTRNPHNTAHTPGGSSAGPAAVVAAGMVPLSLGTQTAGSVNRPAAYCGIAAFKPSTRAWSSFGLVPFSPSFDTVGVFGHRVSDVVAAAHVLMPAYLRYREVAMPARLSIGFIDDPITEAASAAVADTLRIAADKLTGSGVRVERIEPPVPFADVGGWHKTMIEYEVARAYPGLEHNPDVSAGLRDAIARGRFDRRCGLSRRLRGAGRGAGTLLDRDRSRRRAGLSDRSRHRARGNENRRSSLHRAVHGLRRPNRFHSGRVRRRRLAVGIDADWPAGHRC